MSLFVFISHSTGLAADLTPLLTGQYKLADIAGPGDQGERSGLHPTQHQLHWDSESQSSMLGNDESSTAGLSS